MNHRHAYHGPAPAADAATFWPLPCSTRLSLTACPLRSSRSGLRPNGPLRPGAPASHRHSGSRSRGNVAKEGRICRQPACCIKRHRVESSAVPIDTGLLPIAALAETTETSVGDRPGFTCRTGAPDAPKSTRHDITKVVRCLARTSQLRSKLGRVA